MAKQTGIRTAWIGLLGVVGGALVTGLFTLLRPGAVPPPSTVVNVFPSAPEQLDPSIRTYFQFPAYKSLTLAGKLEAHNHGEFQYSIATYHRRGALSRPLGGR